MAFEIQTTQRSPSSRSTSVISNLDTRSGAGQVAQAVGQDGSELTRMAIIRNDLQAKVQISEFDRMALQAKSDLEVALAGQATTDNFKQLYDDSVSGLEGATPKNKKAAFHAQDVIANLRINGEKTMLIEGIKRDRETALLDIFDKIESGNFEGLTEEIGLGVASGLLTAPQAIALRGEITAKKRRFRIDALAARGTALAVSRVSGKTQTERTARAHKFLREQGDLTSAERNEVKRRIDGAAVDSEIRIEEGKKAFELEIMNEPMDTPINDVLDKIKDGPLEVPEQDSLLRSTLFRRQAISQGDPDPLVYRKNNDLYWDLLQKATDHTVTESDIRSAVGWDPENRETTGIAVNDYLQMTNILNASDGVLSSKAKSQTAIMKEMDGFFADIDTDFLIIDNPKQAVRTAQIKARNILEGKMQEAETKGKPLQGMDLIQEMLRVQREVQRELTDGATTESILPTAKGFDAKYKAMPSGTIFIAPDGTRRRKP